MPLRIVSENEFFGRKEELKVLHQTALEAEKGNAQSFWLAGPRGIGKTELLKQMFNCLFWKQNNIAPFYYAVNNALLSVTDFSRDYLTRYISQRLSFEKKEAALIYCDGMSLEGLISIAEERKATWAIEILDRYAMCREPIDSLRMALSTPHLSTLSTGVTAVVMIDEFQNLKNLHIGGCAAPALVSLFDEIVFFRRTPHFVTGSQAEIQEMAIAGSLERIDIKPIQLENAAWMFSSLLEKHGMKTDLISNAVFHSYLGGNPFYINCVAKAVIQNRESGEEGLWRTYIRELNDGKLYLYWSAILKNFFPELLLRKKVLEIIYKIYHQDEPFKQERILKTFSLSKEEAEGIIKAMYLSGFVNGEFGVVKAPENNVLLSFIECLYKREILGQDYKNIEKEMIERLVSAKNKGISFEMTIPMLKEAELVAAQCIEQVGKNLGLNPDVIGQLQIAVIEACINAAEHSGGEERKIFLKIDFFGDRLEISIENMGREFVSPETGEPFVGKGLKEGAGRGWGINLMKKFADSVRFEKTGNRTKVVLVKNLSGAAINKGDRAGSE